MEIKSISIDNFRSIKKMKDISSKLSIFVGPNDWKIQYFDCIGNGI